MKKVVKKHQCVGGDSDRTLATGGMTSRSGSDPQAVPATAKPAIKAGSKGNEDGNGESLSNNTYRS